MVQFPFANWYTRSTSAKQKENRKEMDSIHTVIHACRFAQRRVCVYGEASGASRGRAKVLLSE